MIGQILPGISKSVSDVHVLTNSQVVIFMLDNLYTMWVSFNYVYQMYLFFCYIHKY